MSIVHINYCRYQPFPIPKLINIKVDHSMLSTNITRQQPMFQMLNEMNIATRLHEFFSCRRIQEELILFFSPQIFIRDSLNLGREPLGFLSPVVALVTILISFNTWNIGCCRVMFVDSIEWSNWYWKWMISTIIYSDNGHWRHGLVWTMDIEDVWLMDIEEYVEYWWCLYAYIHYCSRYLPLTLIQSS